MTIATDFENNLAKLGTAVLVDFVAARPGLRVAELRTLVAEHPELGAISLAELVGAGTKAKAAPSLEASTPKRSAKARRTSEPKVEKTKATAPERGAKTKVSEAPPASETPKPRAGNPKATSGWRTRTEAGRDALDAAVLAALEELGGEDISAEQLRARFEVSGHQLRSSLNRHIAAGVLTYSGQARGTRYSLA